MPCSMDRAMSLIPRPQFMRIRTPRHLLGAQRDAERLLERRLVCGLFGLLLESTQGQRRVACDEKVAPDVSRRGKPHQGRGEEVLQDLHRIRVDGDVATPVLEHEDTVHEVVLLGDVQGVPLSRERPQCRHILDQLVEDLRPARQGGGGCVHEIGLHVSAMAASVEAVPELVAPKPIKAGCIAAHQAPLAHRDVPEVEVGIRCVSSGGIFHVRNDIVDPRLRCESCHGVSQAIGVMETLEELLRPGLTLLGGQHWLADGGHVSDREIGSERECLGCLSGNGCHGSSPWSAVLCFGDECMEGGVDSPGKRRSITFRLLRAFAMNMTSLATSIRELIIELRNGRGKGPWLPNILTFPVN